MSEIQLKPKKYANATSFQRGNKLSKGRPAAGMQSFKDRLVRWLETKTYKEIQELVDNPKRWDKLLSIDAMVVRRIHEACQKDKTGDFNAVLDRLLGKPAITGDLQVTHALADRLDSAEKLLATDAVFEVIEQESSPSALTAQIEADDFSDLI